MKLLHTSDWHVGKGVRGHSRDDEHEAVLAEIVGLAAQHDVDVVLIAGDVFDTASPSAKSEAIVYRALLDLGATGATIAVIAGNHDNARRLKAVAPILELGQIHVVSEILHPDDGGMIEIENSSGEKLQLAMIPFVSQRGIIRSRELLENTSAENADAYDEYMQGLINLMCSKFRKDASHVLMTHAFVQGGEPGGGERMAHLEDAYSVSKKGFAKSIDYVALGHLHRAQQVGDSKPIYYSGSPLQFDFKKNQGVKQVNLVELSPGMPATVKPLKLKSGRRFQTLTGSVEELRVAAEKGLPDNWFKVELTDARKAGIADVVREIIGPRVIHVELPSADSEEQQQRRPKGLSPTELFSIYLNEQGFDDPDVRSLFGEYLNDELNDEVSR